MKSVRERFEEVYPVPSGIEWSEYFGKYILSPNCWTTIGLGSSYNARLDTFRRCDVAQTELLDALVALQTAAYNIGGEHVIDYRQLIDAADSADDIIAKARGEK